MKDRVLIQIERDGAKTNNRRSTIWMRLPRSYFCLLSITLGNRSVFSRTYLLGGESWATPTCSGGGNTLYLVATNKATQSKSNSSDIDLPINNFIIPITLGGSFDGTTYIVSTNRNYIITVSAATDPSHRLHLAIEVNGNEISYGGSSNTSALPANRARTGISAVVALTTGNTVKRH